ncbi:hypothetical protein [Vannielia litorea]|uniref:hypothetical protein n=1 Tax=Vannielia litorea TaxID=1217970 RepID=UPI001C9829F4|nr:hypothetical protein [Vannielia litorea]MBY6047319.1 hypothetical protein [Vannielia litorea]MBY6074733.1 hypothetical protein [Vannielia litorea]
MPALKPLALAATLALTPLAATAQSGPALIDQSDPEHVARVAGVLTGMGFQVEQLNGSERWGFLATYKGSKLLLAPVSCNEGKPCNFLRFETRYSYPAPFDEADISDFNTRAWCCKMVQPEPGKIHLSMTLPFTAPMTEEYLRSSLVVHYSMHNTAWDMLTEWNERGASVAAAPAGPAPDTPSLGVSPAEIKGAAPAEQPKLGVGIGSFSLEDLME